jgi:2,3-bisphosphoglycerate-independent phosphoglycerate mutase
MPNIPKPLVLIILDGWGYRSDPANNAIAAANKPTWDKLWATYPHILIDASGHAVGLPDKQMGNSEVGHMHIGAGRVINQDLTRIDQAIADRSFNQNPVLLQAIKKIQSSEKALHILGLLSAGGVHAHEQHIYAMVKLAAEKGAKKIYVHAFTDGRDTSPQSAMHSLETLHNLCNELSKQYQADIRIVSVIGRYYAMDRDNRWDRIQQAYDLIVSGQAQFHSNNPTLALTLAYARNETDEFVQATAIHAPQTAPVTLQDGDTVIFMNFRSDRARQLTRALSQPDFAGFIRSRHPKLDTLVTLTKYADDIPAQIAYPHVTLSNNLGEWLAKQHKTQLRIAETEKYAHVTFFFNGGIETPNVGEDRILIPSPRVATYDQQPEMSAPEITTKLVEAIQQQRYDVIIANFANADMIGHTGNFEATKLAIATLDQCLKQITEALLAVGGEALITADHGNAELMYDPETTQAHTAHTNFLVPLLYVGLQGKFNVERATLVDIAPTMLSLLHLPIPAEMTGKNLLT